MRRMGGFCVGHKVGQQQDVAVRVNLLAGVCMCVFGGGRCWVLGTQIPATHQCHVTGGDVGVVGVVWRVCVCVCVRWWRLVEAGGWVWQE